MAGFQLFDSTHLLWLFSITLVIIIYCYIYKHTPKRNIYLVIIFILLFGIELAKQIYLYTSGRYTYYSPPLHLCGMGIFICGMHAFWPNKITSTLLFALTLPGAVIALLFPGWATDPVGSFLHIHSFVFHSLLVAFVIPPLIYGELNISIKELYWAPIFLIGTVPFIYSYNNHFQTNFMFLNKPVVNTPLQWIYDSVGPKGYLGGLAVIMLIIWLIMYSIYYLLHRSRKTTTI